MRRRIHAGGAARRGHAGRLGLRRSVAGLLLRVAGLLLGIARLLLGIAGLLTIAGLLLTITGLLLAVTRLLAVPGLPVAGLSLLPTLGILRRGFFFFTSANGGENERGGHQTAGQ